MYFSIFEGKFGYFSNFTGKFTNFSGKIRIFPILPLFGKLPVNLPNFNFPEN